MTSLNSESSLNQRSSEIIKALNSVNSFPPHVDHYFSDMSNRAKPFSYYGGIMFVSYVHWLNLKLTPPPEVNLKMRHHIIWKAKKTMCNVTLSLAPLQLHPKLKLSRGLQTFSNLCLYRDVTYHF